MDSVPQFHMDSLLSLASHQLDIWVIFFPVYTGSLKFSGRREAENKLGWLQERRLEKIFLFCIKVWVLQQKETRETQILYIGGQSMWSVPAGWGWSTDREDTSRDNVNVSAWSVLQLAGNKHCSSPGVQLLHMCCRNASQRLLERTLESKGNCAQELIG